MRKFDVQSEANSTAEAERQRALESFDILDTLPEQGYEDVTELASFICGTPISLISLVDKDRQWFKSEHGLGERETPRDESFCAHTIPSGEMLVVEDAQSDPRFQNNPLVMGDPKIRFYAGAPIMDGGQVLGTVCVIDRVPRRLTSRQLTALQALARQVETLLHLRRGLKEAEREASRLAGLREVLRQSEARMALAADAAGIATWFYDPALDVVGGDARMGAWFGLEVTEGPVELWLRAVHPEDRERVGWEFARGVEGQPYDSEYRVVAGSSVRWMRAKARLLTAGSLRRMVGICEEITERKQTEEELRTTAARLRMAQSAGRVATWEWDLASQTVSWGEESRLVYGRAPSELSDPETAVSFLHPDDIAHMRERLQPALEGTGEYRAEFRVLWPDGSVHWTEGFGRAVLSADGRPIALVGCNIDISERKVANEALLRTEKLAAVGRLASTMAHEINNPLEAVTNLLYLARHSADFEEARPYLTTADAELRRASAITNQALRFHKQATRPTAVTFEQLVVGILVGQRSRLANAGGHLEERNRAGRAVLCFEGEVRQVLSNLVGNAIDALHGKGGTLLLRGRDGHDWRTGQAGMVLTVADTGIGMSEVTTAKLFDAFYTTKGISGTGLGLWISKEIMDRHKGRIVVKSRQGVGSVFLLFLPYDAVSRRMETVA